MVILFRGCGVVHPPEALQNVFGGSGDARRRLPLAAPLRDLSGRPCVSGALYQLHPMSGMSAARPLLADPAFV